MPDDDNTARARTLLDDAVASLGEVQQDAIVLHHLQGKTVKETALALGCPERTVKERVAQGLERLAMYLQKVDNIFDLVWVPGITYRDVYHRNEVEFSHYNFHHADVPALFAGFEASRLECERLCDHGLPLPAYHAVMRCSHMFNLLLARGAISVAERAQYIKRIRDLACRCARVYLLEPPPGQLIIEKGAEKQDGGAV